MTVDSAVDTTDFIAKHGSSCCFFAGPIIPEEESANILFFFLMMFSECRIHAEMQWNAGE
ncbi:MAG: hypothetical protein CL912_02070 [Deltaproteobacteria bacterium]|nr:hypothetical protein [Deltaproteobacteria bacterium]|tara:strand:- start:492 stop:671 length:180 start_codon:yes stop_codon:yes gene_type:complete